MKFERASFVFDRSRPFFAGSVYWELLGAENKRLTYVYLYDIVWYTAVYHVYDSIPYIRRYTIYMRACHRYDSMSLSYIKV